MTRLLTVLLSFIPFFSFSLENSNVLFITIDIMNDWTTVFNKNNPIQLPNIERLADRGVFFKRACCSSPANNPSRGSVMTGTRPHKTEIYGNNSVWRSALPRIKTIVEKLKKYVPKENADQVTDLK